MKFAWVENNVIRDVCHGNPIELYHPDVAAFYTAEVPDDAANGDGWDGETLTKPEPMQPSDPPAPVPPKLSPVEFKLLFTSAERIAIKTLRVTDPVVDDFFELLDDPRLTGVNLALQSVQDAVGYVLAALPEGTCVPDVATRVAEVLTGVAR